MRGIPYRKGLLKGFLKKPFKKKPFEERIGIPF